MIKFHCPHCSTKISAEELQAGNFASCPFCNGDIVVPTSEGGMNMEPQNVHLFFVFRRGIEMGPFSEDQIRSMLQSGMLDSSDLARKDGTSESLPVAVHLGVEQPTVSTLPHSPGSASSTSKWGRKTRLIVVGSLVGLLVIIAIVAWPMSAKAVDDVMSYRTGYVMGKMGRSFGSDAKLSDLPSSGFQSMSTRQKRFAEQGFNDGKKGNAERYPPPSDTDFAEWMKTQR